MSASNVKFQMRLSEAHEAANKIVKGRPNLEKESTKIHAYINALSNKKHVTFEMIEKVIVALKNEYPDCF